MAGSADLTFLGLWVHSRRTRRSPPLQGDHQRCDWTTCMGWEGGMQGQGPMALAGMLQRPDHQGLCSFRCSTVQAEVFKPSSLGAPWPWVHPDRPQVLPSRLPASSYKPSPSSLSQALEAVKVGLFSLHAWCMHEDAAWGRVLVARWKTRWQHACVPRLASPCTSSTISHAHQKGC